MNPFNFCWSGKLLISPSILKNNLSKRLFYTSVFLLLSCIQGYWEREQGMIWENGIQFSLLSNFHISIKFSSVQSLSRVRLFVTPWIAARQASMPIINSWSLLRLTSIESVMPFSHLILCRPLLLLPPIPPSFRVFSNESNSLYEVAKVLEFQF